MLVKCAFIVCMQAPMHVQLTVSRLVWWLPKIGESTCERLMQASHAGRAAAHHDQLPIQLKS